MTPRLKYAAIFLLIALVVAHEGMSMDEPGPEAESQRNSLHEHWKTRTFHWLVSLFILVITPSVGAAYAVANRTIVSLGIQVICQIYAFLEALFFRFNDVNGHENSTSRGTAWFMVFFYIGLIVNGLAAKRIQSKVINITYKVLSCAVVLLGLIKLAMSVVAMLGFCYDSHTGQCNAHGIMGMSFIFYGFILSMSLMIPWLRHNNGRYSQEMYDSTVITIWGIINTFTEHRPWEPWSHSDYQHTSMGIIFWCAGMLGMYLSLGKKRNFVPALTLIFTGYAMSEHVQELIISTKVHAFFGIVLMAGGFSRIMEISFLLDDQDEPVDKEIRSFQYLAPFALVLSGVLFMSATEEQLQLVVNMGADHSAYILVIISAACLLQLWILSILQLYLNLATANDSYKQVVEELELSDLEV